MKRLYEQMIKHKDYSRVHIDDFTPSFPILRWVYRGHLNGALAVDICPYEKKKVYYLYADEEKVSHYYKVPGLEEITREMRLRFGPGWYRG